MVKSLKFILCIFTLCLMLSSAALAQEQQKENNQSESIEAYEDKYSQKESMLAERLDKYVKQELTGAKYFRQLADLTKSAEQKNILLEIAQNQDIHAKDFARYIPEITGKEYLLPEVPEPVLPSDFKEAVRAGFKNLTDTFEEYAAEYIYARKESLKKLFYKSGIEDNVNAERLLLLLDIFINQ